MRPVLKISAILGTTACVLGLAAYGVFLALPEADSAEQTHIKGAVKAALTLLKAMPTGGTAAHCSKAK